MAPPNYLLSCPLLSSLLIGVSHRHHVISSRLMPPSCAAPPPQVWQGKETLQAVVRAGFRGILSDNDLWYSPGSAHLTRERDRLPSVYNPLLL
jgi:hypothetical protein